MALQSRKGNAAGGEKQSGTYVEVPTSDDAAKNDATPALERLAMGRARQRQPLETDLMGQEDQTSDECPSSQRNIDKQQCIQHWKDSHYAVGIVPPSWRDEIRHRQNRAAESLTDRGIRTSNICTHACHSEDVGAEENLCCCLILSGWVCGDGHCAMKARRIGNMVVLKERPFDVSQKNRVADSDEDSSEEEESPALNDEENPETRRKMYAPPNPPTEIICMVGPYWPVLFCLTYPLVLGVSGATLVFAIPYQRTFIQIFWAVMTALLLYMLFNVSCRDPGVLLRHTEDPTPSLSEFRGRRNGAWKWNDTARSFHPRTAVYDPDCAVVIEEYDHVCPWTGTAIGKKNMSAFHAFVGSIFLCLMMDVLLLTGAVGGPYGFMAAAAKTGAKSVATGVP